MEVDHQVDPVANGGAELADHASEFLHRRDVGEGLGKWHEDHFDGRVSFCDRLVREIDRHFGAEGFIDRTGVAPAKVRIHAHSVADPAAK